MISSKLMHVNIIIIIISSHDSHHGKGIDDNLICEIINPVNSINSLKIEIKKLNNFIFLYYCLRYKKQFRKLLYEKVREPVAIKKYHPNNLIKRLDENSDLDMVLEEW
jgi:hypothetical protein